MAKSKQEPIIIETVSGKEFDLWEMTADDIVADDIALSLSRQRRYLGHTVIPWSVAQHSILCSMIADKLKGDKVNIKACFIHDFEECYVQDIIAPLKRSKCVNGTYEKLSEHVSKIIFDHYDCHGYRPEFVKMVDSLAYCFEHVAFRPNSKHDPHVSEKVWKNFLWLVEDLKMGIPEGLINMSEDEQVKILYEFMIVQQAEISFGQEISAEVEDVVEGIEAAFGKETTNVTIQ